MKTHTYIFMALAGLLLASCEEKTPTGTPATSPPPAPPSPSLSPPATAESTPSSPPPSPLKSPEGSTPAVMPSPTASSTATLESTPSATPEAAAPLNPSPPATSSDGRPTFSSQSANEYLQSYDAYINDFKLAYQAMKQGDMTKYQAVIQRAHELESKGEKLGGELSPEEEARFADYLSRKADELAQLTGQNR